MEQQAGDHVAHAPQRRRLKPLPQVLTPVSRSNRVHATPEEQSPERHQVASSSSVQSTFQEQRKKKDDSTTKVFDGSAQLQTVSQQACKVEVKELVIETARKGTSDDYRHTFVKELEIEKARKWQQKVQAWPSDDQRQTFEQCALSCKEEQIEMHVEVAKLVMLGLLDKDEESTLYHRIHNRDPDIILRIRGIREHKAKTAKELKELVKEEEAVKDLRVDLKKHITHLYSTWEEAGAQKPSTGTEIKNDILAAELQKKVEFKKEEWEKLQVAGLSSNTAELQKKIEFKTEEWGKLQVAGLSSNSYIKAGDRYFKPAAAQVKPIKPFLSTRLPFKRKGHLKGVQILQVPAKEDLINVHLVRYFVENVWKLQRPDVIISITGGAQNFDLPPEHKDRMMRGMMEGTRQLKPWSVSVFYALHFCFVRLWVCESVCVCVRACVRARARLQLQTSTHTHTHTHTSFY